jgi:hypothetical protein
MISEEIKTLINITENFIVHDSDTRDMSHNLKNLTGMLKGIGTTQAAASLPMDIASNPVKMGNAVATDVANSIANVARPSTICH